MRFHLERKIVSCGEAYNARVIAESRNNSFIFDLFCCPHDITLQQARNRLAA